MPNIPFEHNNCKMISLLKQIIYRFLSFQVMSLSLSMSNVHIHQFKIIKHQLNIHKALYFFSKTSPYIATKLNSAYQVLLMIKWYQNCRYWRTGPGQSFWQLWYWMLINQYQYCQSILMTMISQRRTRTSSLARDWWSLLTTGQSASTCTL